jgi:hypothetical protein
MNGLVKVGPKPPKPLDPLVEFEAWSKACASHLTGRGS